MTTRKLPAEPAPLVLYEDPLSPWCWIAERRIRTAATELDGAFAPLRMKPFPLRAEARALSGRERRMLARAARRAAREPEGAGTSPELWLSPDAPLTSVPVLTAIAAARLQGAACEEALRSALRDAALVRGVNVARTDVLLELAERAGLDLCRFSSALDAPDTEQRVRAAVEEAVEKGIDGAPALVIGEEWLLAGPRTLEEYRHVLRRYAAARLGVPPSHTVH